MKASAASRCAWSELKSCSRPSSVDLRVYTAHRTEGVLLYISPLRQSEEQEPIPTSTGNLARDGAQRTVAARPEKDTGHRPHNRPTARSRRLDGAGTRPELHRLLDHLRKGDVLVR